MNKFRIVNAVKNNFDCAKKRSVGKKILDVKRDNAFSKESEREYTLIVSGFSKEDKYLPRL